MPEFHRRETSAKSWRVFYTRARAEKKCEKQLEDNRIEVFLPKRTVVRQWSDRRQKVVLPLFSNYLFARVNERERIAVLRSSGIVRCVTFCGRPAAVTEEEIDRLQIMQARTEWLEPAEKPRPDVGEEVIIESGPLEGLTGPLEGLIGVVVEHRRDTHLVVETPSIKRAVKVVIPAGSVREESGSAP